MSTAPRHSRRTAPAPPSVGVGDFGKDGLWVYDAQARDRFAPHIQSCKRGEPRLDGRWKPNLLLFCPKPFQAGIPKELFQAQLVPDWVWRNIYAPSPDGQRFLMLTPAGEAEPQPITEVVNWPALLKNGN